MKYCNKTLVYSPVHYGLVTSQKQYEKELKKLNVDKKYWDKFVTEGSGATVHFLDRDGETICIVGIEAKDYTLEQIYAMLTHEAVHIWQEIKLQLGEKEPSYEFEAYSIQNITQNLMEAYKRLEGKKNV